MCRKTIFLFWILLRRQKILYSLLCNWLIYHILTSYSFTFVWGIWFRSITLIPTKINVTWFYQSCRLIKISRKWIHWFFEDDLSLMKWFITIKSLWKKETITSILHGLSMNLVIVLSQIETSLVIQFVNMLPVSNIPCLILIVFIFIILQRNLFII